MLIAIAWSIFQPGIDIASPMLVARLPDSGAELNDDRMAVMVEILVLIVEILVLIGVLAIVWLLSSAAYSLVIGIIRGVLNDIRGNGDARNARRRERERDFPPERDSMADKLTAAIDEALTNDRIVVTNPDSGESVVVTVRKIRNLEWLQAQVKATPLLDDMARALTAGGGDIDVDTVQDVLNRHADLWTVLVALASGRHAVWLERLSDEDRQELGLAMWRLNSDFLSTRVATLAVSK